VRALLLVEGMLPGERLADQRDEEEDEKEERQGVLEQPATCGPPFSPTPM
jgi:hypothetical protein